MLWLYAIRTIIFYVMWIIWTPLFITIYFIFIYPFFSKQFFSCFFSIQYSRVFLWLCRVICGITWVVEGRENIPKQPCIIVSNHQSAWETFLLHILFIPQNFVLKEELLHIPFFGWGLAHLSPIAIDRKKPRQAIRQLLKQGGMALKANHWVIIFPEGTRHIDQLGDYSHGAAMLAQAEKRPILPIVHTAGLFWSKRSWIKKPGTIKVCIGPVITVEDLSTKSMTQEVFIWSQSVLNHHMD
ncbi:MAG: 1-acyl-sn-glycerol-3-phosphate acyltransferase [Endozoicomonadaceae bacterium]|nr:1-acyl-sn-glycerol-3-phosphate acyltransferase [Endozoicomonadaceae bacterium]